MHNVIKLEFLLLPKMIIQISDKIQVIKLKLFKFINEVLPCIPCGPSSPGKPRSPSDPWSPFSPSRPGMLFHQKKQITRMLIDRN